MKQVPATEYNRGHQDQCRAENIINASIDLGVERARMAANPINLYGATKLCSDKLFIAGNHYSGKRKTRFAVVRYGNVVGSRGSVIPFFLAKKKTGVLPITDKRMTRFWITLQQGVDFVVNSIERMHGGEIYVPKIPSMNIMDLADAIAPECKIEVVGIRPGEKLHEVMVPEDDARSTVELDDRYVIQPTFKWWDSTRYSEGTPCVDNFRYASDTNDRWLTREELRKMVAEVRRAQPAEPRRAEASS